jgi:hypothetical protein
MLTGDANHALNPAPCGWQVPDVGKIVSLSRGECVDFLPNQLSGQHGRVMQGQGFLRTLMTGSGKATAPVTIYLSRTCPPPG